MSFSTPFERICTKLDAHQVAYALSTHPPVTTSEEAAQVRGVEMKSGAKALVITGDKSEKCILCVLPADLRLDRKKVKEMLGEAFSFAPDPELVTGCVKGSVPPFGSTIGLITYCDQRLADNEYINFNAGTLTDSIQMKYVDYFAVEKPNVVDIAEQMS